jgi:hypothetical protein
MPDKETQSQESNKQETTVAKSTPKKSEARKERAFYYPDAGENGVTVLAKDRKEADNKLKEVLKQDKDQS